MKQYSYAYLCDYFRSRGLRLRKSTPTEGGRYMLANGGQFETFRDLREVNDRARIERG